MTPSDHHTKIMSDLDAKLNALELKSKDPNLSTLSKTINYLRMAKVGLAGLREQLHATTKDPDLPTREELEEVSAELREEAKAMVAEIWEELKLYLRERKEVRGKAKKDAKGNVGDGGKKTGFWGRDGGRMGDGDFV